ncbi:MAG TPA: aquaporin Z [Bryobacteraceae bacterium]|nr:aquaporin Z [Bryobacteraceae bacterium]
MNKYIAESVGTFVLVFGGCGAAVLAGDKIGYAGVALAFGLSLLAMVYTIGHVSGCHINPAVTLGLFLAKKLPAKDVLGYWVAQVIGAIIAAACLLVVAKGAPNGYDASALGFAANGYGAHSPGNYGLFAAAVTEIILTFFLVITVIGATDIKAPAGFAGLPIGFVLVLIHLVGIPVTNTSVNPARSIGPALFVGGWAIAQLWLFILAPLAGAALAAAVYRSFAVPRLSARESETALRLEQEDRLRSRPAGV